jgi:biopolymer transport protein ExbD
MRRRKKMDISVPTTSMGDIAFLLIIFFMVCSNFAKESKIKLKPTDAVDIKAVENAKISVVIDEASAIYLDGQLINDVATLKLLIENALPDKANSKARMVMFKCDRFASKRVFEPVLDAIASAGGIIVAVGEKRASEGESK